VGQKVDADAQGFQVRHRLENLCLNAGGVQAQGCGQPADTAADHDDTHLFSLSILYM